MTFRNEKMVFSDEKVTFSAGEKMKYIWSYQEYCVPL